MRPDGDTMRPLLSHEPATASTPAYPEIAVLIVSYNTRDLTVRAVDTLLAQTHTPMEVVVIDNGSEDGSAEAVEQYYPTVHVIRSSSNLGFARANNLASKHTSSPYLLLLNSDTEVLPTAVDHLLEFAKRRPDAGIWGGRTLFADGSLNLASCWSRQTLWSLLVQALGLTTLFRRTTLFNPEGMGAWLRDDEREVDIVSGCFLLIERGLWEALGGFSPHFFMYGEDADLCLRARALGARPATTPEATIVHHGGASERVAADKLVRLLNAKAHLIRNDFSPYSRPLALALLAAWPFSRMFVHRLIDACRLSGPRDKAKTWSEVWKRRREWLQVGDSSAPKKWIAS